MPKNIDALLIFLLAILLALPGNSHAFCMLPAQRLVEISVESCEFVKISNRDHIEEFLDGLDSQEKNAMESLIGTISGVSIKGTVLAWQEILHGTTGWANAPGPDQLYRHWEAVPDMDVFFYRTDDQNKCNEFEKTVTFLDDGGGCCDVVPGGPACYIPGISIKDVPEILKDVNVR